MDMSVALANGCYVKSADCQPHQSSHETYELFASCSWQAFLICHAWHLASNANWAFQQDGCTKVLFNTIFVIEIVLRVRSIGIRHRVGGSKKCHCCFLLHSSRNACVPKCLRYCSPFNPAGFFEPWPARVEVQLLVVVFHAS